MARSEKNNKIKEKGASKKEKLSTGCAQKRMYDRIPLWINSFIKIISSYYIDFHIDFHRLIHKKNKSGKGLILKEGQAINKIVK